MKYAALGASKGRARNILPDNFDLDVVQDFFATTKYSVPGLENAAGKAKIDLSELARPFAAEAPAVEPEETSGEDAAGSWKDDAAGSWKDKGAGGKNTDTGSGGEAISVKGGGRGKNKEQPVEDAPLEEAADQPAPPPVEEEAAETPAPPPVEEEAAETPPPAPSDNYITDSAYYVTGLDNPDTDFNISINFTGDWTETQKLAFIEGAERVSEYVVGDIEDSGGVDDLHITASSLDTTGFASGGPRSYTSDGLSKTGQVTFNSNKIDQLENYNVIDDFAFHEILHAMGFGASWGSGDFVETIGGETRYTGENAIAVYNDPESEFASVAATDDYSAFGVPLEADGDHLNHEYFGNEIMSPTLNTSNNVISDLTIAMVEDMGYNTTFDQNKYFGADDFIFV
jgi:hypothetical protein